MRSSFHTSNIRGCKISPAAPSWSRRDAAAVWCDLLFATMDENEDVSCLLADPITGEHAFRELLSWWMTGQIPARYRPYFAPSPLMANPIVIDRAFHVVATVHPALAADICSGRTVPAPGRPTTSRGHDRHEKRRVPHAGQHRRTAPSKCRRLRL
jgi:hypothetical protein